MFLRWYLLLGLNVAVNSQSILWRNEADEKAYKETFDEKYTKYLEEQDHVLIGFNTPIYIASLPETTESIKNNVLDLTIKNYSASIVYKRMYYPIRGDKLTEYPVARNNKTNHHVKSSKASKLDKEPINFLNKTKINSTEPLEIVYPEILVVVDFETYKGFNRNLIDIATYMAAFWNAVDLRFRDFKNPKIRLNIAGLIITTDRFAEPYLKRDSFDGKYFKDIIMTNLIISEYFDTNFHNAFDIVVVMTRRYLEHDGTIGFTLSNGSCDAYGRAAIIKDMGNFDGIVTAAHELGHLFGSPHDEEFNETLCSKSGFIMKERAGHIGPNEIHWSPCSKALIHNFLRSNNISCLRNKPDVIIPHLRKLPGKLMDRKTQCEKAAPGYKPDSETDCTVLKCKKCLFLDVDCEFYYHEMHPLEGAPCGSGHFCLDGKCIIDPGFYD